MAPNSGVLPLQHNVDENGQSSMSNKHEKFDDYIIQTLLINGVLTAKRVLKNALEISLMQLSHRLATFHPVSAQTGSSLFHDTLKG